MIAVDARGKMQQVQPVPEHVKEQRENSDQAILLATSNLNLPSLITLFTQIIRRIKRHF